MSFPAKALKQSHRLAFLVILFGSRAAFGQAATSPIAFSNQDAITTSFVTAPVVGTPTDANGGSSGNTQWLKVEFHYGTTALVTAAYPYVDSVEFKIWVEGLDQYAPNASQPSGKGVAVALMGSVTYVNIPQGKDIYGVFYVPPSTLARYSSDRGYEDFDRKFDIHMEAYVGGTLMDAINKKKEQDPLKWFLPLKPIPDQVYLQNQSPFLLTDPDRYPAIKLPPPAK